MEEGITGLRSTPLLVALSRDAMLCCASQLNVYIIRDATSMLNGRSWENEVEALQEVLAGTAEGQTATYSAMTLRVNEPVTAQYYALQKALKRLERQAIHFECVPGVGYRRLAPGHVATKGTTRSIKKIYRASRRGLKRAEIDKSDYKRLDRHQRLELHAKTAVMSAIKTSAHGNHVRKEVQHSSKNHLAEEMERLRAQRSKSRTTDA